MEITTRDVIIDRAGELFLEYGYEATTMKDIADACEISQGNISYYFKLKQDILLGVLEKIFRTINTDIEMFCCKVDDPMERFLTFQVTSYRICVESESTLNLTVSASAVSEARLSRYDMCKKSFYSYMSEVPLSFEKRDLNMTLAILWGSMDQVMTMYQSSPNDFDFPYMLRFVLNAFLKLLNYSDERAKELIEKSIINSEKIYVEVLRSYHYLNGSNK